MYSRLQAFLGILIFLCFAILLRKQGLKKIKNINMRLLAACFGMQFALAFLLKTFLNNTESWFLKPIFWINTLVESINEAALYGSRYVFGYVAGGDMPFEVIAAEHNFIIAFQILPIILFVTALSSVLYYFGFVQMCLKLLQKSLQKVLNIDALSAMSAAACFFFGTIEAPLLLKEHVRNMTKEQLFLLLTCSMATVSGAVMVLYATVLKASIDMPIVHLITASIISLPAAIAVSHIIMPIAASQNQQYNIQLNHNYDSFMQALLEGCKEGLNVVLNVAVLILVLFAGLYFIDQMVNKIIFFADINLSQILAYILTPVAWLLGIEGHECFASAQLLSKKFLLNEYVAYDFMAKSYFQNNISEHSRLILSYAMCGFANIASMGIISSGLMPWIKQMSQKDFLKLVQKSLLAGFITTLITGSVAAIVLV